MSVTYFDEVKANPANGQSYYIIGGLIVPIEKISALEARLVALADQLFGSTELTPNTEFHASFIYSGKGPFKGLKPEKRIEILAEIASNFSGECGIGRVFSCIDVTKLKLPKNAAKFAFAHFCERVQLYLGKTGTTILLGDLDDETFREQISDFNRFRISGTPWEYGREITSIVDSVHFARSHHSRLIQLADTYVFLVSHPRSGRKGWMAERLREAVKNLDYSPNRYKIWPAK